MAWSAPISGDELLACVSRPRCWSWSSSSSLSSSSPSSLSSPAAATATATVTAGGWIRLPTRDREAEAEKQRRTVKRRREESSSSDTMNMVRHHLVPLALLLVAITLPQSALGADISVRIERHFPCSASSGPKKENLLIKFPSYKTAGVDFHEETNAQGHKCFRMSGGKVEVFPPGLNGSKKYYVHLETRIGIHGKPERCVNADSNGCGGIGSCVHCDICQTMGGSLKNFVQIFQGNKPAQCSSQGLAAGSYTDLSLKVCLPTKNELLPFLDQEIPLVIAARIFDRPINNLSPKEMNDLLHDSKEGMIGCHWIYATVSQQN